MSIPLLVQFSGLCVIAFEKRPQHGTDANDVLGQEEPILNCKEVGEAKLFLLEASKAHQTHHGGTIDEHMPRLTVDLRFTKTDVAPNEIIMATEVDAAQPYGKGIVELGVWNLKGPCFIRSSDPSPTPLKVVWGNRNAAAPAPDPTDKTNHPSDFSWVADLEKCDGAGKLAPGFWSTAAYETRCAARFRLSTGRLRAHTPDTTLYTFKDPLTGNQPGTPYAQAFASAIVLKMGSAKTHTFELADGSEIELTEPATGTWTHKLAQVSNHASLPGRDDVTYGQEHIGAYYDLTELGAKDLDAVVRYIPYRAGGGGVGVYRPKCIFGQTYE